MSRLGLAAALLAASSATGCELVAGLGDSQLAPAKHPPGMLTCSGTDGTDCGNVGCKQMVLVSTGMQLDGVAVDDTTVYLADDIGAVLRVPIGGGDVTTMTAPMTLQEDEDVKVDGDIVFAADDGAGNIAMLPKDAANATPMFVATDQSNPENLAVADEGIYWTENAADGSIDVAPKMAGATPTRLGNQNNAAGIALDGTFAFWVNGGTVGGSDGAVMRATRPNLGAPLRIADSQPEPSSIAVDDSYVYWTTRVAVMRAKKDGSEVTKLFDDSTPRSIAVSAKNLFWLHDYVSDALPDGLLKLQKNTTTPILLYQEGGLSRLTLACSGIYVVNDTTAARIWRP